MSEERIIQARDFDRQFCFSSFGVDVVVASNNDYLLEKARSLVGQAFGHRAKIFEEAKGGREHVFGLSYDDGSFGLYKNGEFVASGHSERNFLKYLNSALRIEVGEFAKDRVFVHAGVVGWHGQAIIMPGSSYSGKSTLTAELVRLGAEYFSDEYAVLRPDGFVETFPRHLSIRKSESRMGEEISAESLGGKVGQEPIAVGMVLMTWFSKDASWSPEILGPGAGIMEIMPNVLTVRKNPAFSLKVLDLVARRAIIVKSPRGEVKNFAKFLLAYFDKHTKLTKLT